MANHMTPRIFPSFSVPALHSCVSAALSAVGMMPGPHLTASLTLRVSYRSLYYTTGIFLLKRDYIRHMYPGSKPNDNQTVDFLHPAPTPISALPTPAPRTSSASSSRSLITWARSWAANSIRYAAVPAWVSSFLVLVDQLVSPTRYPRTSYIL